MQIPTPFLDALWGQFWTIWGTTWAPKRTPKQPRTGPVFTGRRTGLPPIAEVLSLGPSRSPPGPPRARLWPLFGPSRGPLRPFLASFGPFSGRLWLVLGSVLAISYLLLWKGARVKRASVHITDPLVMMTSRRPIDTYNIDQPHGIPEPNKRWDTREMEHRNKQQQSPAGGSCIILGICSSRLGAVFASSGENWNGRAVNAKRLESARPPGRGAWGI